MQVSFTGSVVSSRPSFNTSNTDNKSNTGVSLQTQPQKMNLNVLLKVKLEI